MKLCPSVLLMVTARQARKVLCEPVRERAGGPEVPETRGQFETGTVRNETEKLSRESWKGSVIR